MLPALMACVLSPAVQAQDRPSARLLPAPSDEPMHIDSAADPVLALGRRTGNDQLFRAAITRAVAEAPSSAEAIAQQNVSEAARRQTRAGLFPSVDVGLSSYRTLARQFSNSENVIIERARAQERTDATLAVTQTLLDFGATSTRIAAAGDRLRSASAGIDVAADQVALRAIAAWYDVFVYRAMVRIGEAFSASQSDLRLSVQQRVRQGYSAEGDVSRVDSYIASADSRLAGYRRQLANAEARYTQLLRAPAPADLVRAPLVTALPLSHDLATYGAMSAPAVKVAEADAAAARQDARAAKSDTLPKVTTGLNAGRYGVYENPGDYDVRVTVNLQKRFFGGVNARADQYRAQAGVAQARADRAREEAVRDASIAWSDVQALEEQQRALERSYLAARQSRDVLAERFRVSRGSLFDVLGAEDAFFLTATSYIEGVGDLDAARYVLLSRSGKLLDALSIPSAQGTRR